MKCLYCDRPALRIVLGGGLCREHGFKVQAYVNALSDADRSNSESNRDGRAKDRVGRYKCAKFSPRKRRP